MFLSLQWQTSSAPSMKKLRQLCVPIFRCRCCEGHSVKRITISQQCHDTPTSTSKHRRCATSQIFHREHQFCWWGKSRRTWTFSDSYTSVTNHGSIQSFTQERAWNLNIYCKKHLFLQHKRGVPVSLLSRTQLKPTIPALLQTTNQNIALLYFMGQNCYIKVRRKKCVTCNFAPFDPFSNTFTDLITHYSGLSHKGSSPEPLSRLYKRIRLYLVLTATVWCSSLTHQH